MNLTGFLHKEALEVAVADEMLNAMLGELRAVTATANSQPTIKLIWRTTFPD
jgi:hypothetical protein